MTDYLLFELCDQNKQPFPDPQNVSLKPGEISYLKIKNTYSHTLNVAVLDIEPTWEISQIPIQGDFASFFPLDSGQEAYTKLRLALPADYQQTKETLKIFATKGLANFQWLILPSLDEQPRSKGNLNRSLYEKAEEAKSRGSSTNINPLNSFLTAIGNDIDNPPEKTRAMVYESEPEAEWITKDIVIMVQ
ncbi:MAG: hypothetical protein RLZZ74_1377 [Cyanobacteriota bacterium]